MDKKIYEMHRIQRMSINDIAKELKINRNRIVEKMLPDGYSKGDLIQCEYCGAYFNPRKISGKGAYYTLSCSVSCGRKMAYLLNTNLELPVYNGVKKLTKQESTEAPKTEFIWDEYINDYVEVPIPEFIIPNKKLREDANAARDCRKSYGTYIADEDHKKANDIFFSMGIYDDSFQQYIDSLNRR